ncbi:unnamed protein product [Linum trigynum]|uniref:Uncharacterized protein n=1 Tax=Linum trigynum TaxID=586398 RepID=A0AAV2GJD8_9ROSI
MSFWVKKCTRRIVVPVLLRFPVAYQILPHAARTQPRRVAFNIKQKEERGKSVSGDFEKKLALPLPTSTTEKKLIRQKRSGSATASGSSSPHRFRASIELQNHGSGLRLLVRFDGAKKEELEMV